MACAVACARQIVDSINTVSFQVLEDMPQEMRSRLWYVLLESPDMAQALMVGPLPNVRSFVTQFHTGSVLASAYTPIMFVGNTT